jgi:glycosyltransferase involved in cell wall biosynthesis
MSRLRGLLPSGFRRGPHTATSDGIVVLDDRFPDLMTGFRVAEFSWLLRQGVVREVMSTHPQLDEHLPAFVERYPDLEGRVTPYRPERLPEFELAYLVFLDNAAGFLADLEHASLDFVVELYPGGGLRLGTEATDAVLTRVVASPLLRHIVTTQPRVTEYLTTITAELPPVVEILGVVVNESYFTDGEGSDEGRPYFGYGKTQLDVLFAAHRYDERGVNKGYPVFVEACSRLAEAGVPIRAHVVGGHVADDIPLGDVSDRFRFHGPLVTEEFQRLARGMDLVLSPNRPFVVRPGVWDGFPTGSCVEAALCGAGVVCSDELVQNRVFTDGEDIVIVSPDPVLVTDRVLELLQRPDGVRGLAARGQQAFRRAYAPDAQLVPRREALVASLAAVRTTSTSAVST